MWAEIIRLIHQHQRFLITAHTNPDLDAIGSELALEEYLAGLGKHVLIVNSDAMPRAYRQVDPQRRAHVYSPRRHADAVRQAEIIFTLDVSGGWQRIGRVGQVLAATQARVVRIDHHPDPTEIAHLEAVDTGAAATAELIFDLFMQAGASISITMARWLYLAILTDTGSFHYPKTSSRTHQIVSRLIEAGADPAQLYRVAYEAYPLNRTRLKGHVLESLQVTAGGRVAWCALDQATMEAYGASIADLDGFAGLGLEVSGVQASALCVATSKGEVKVSLRSDGSFAVNDLAAEWGGGGHPSAAGATLKGELGQVTGQVLNRVEALVRAGRTGRAIRSKIA
jgi:phosphoesterase RecJ-like protein